MNTTFVVTVFPFTAALSASAKRLADFDVVISTYSFVPLQDFSKPWTDEELYAKYGLTEEEIAFIESMIKPMES